MKMVLTSDFLEFWDWIVIFITLPLFMIKNIEDIYFFEVNTKYISSNVMKISVISRVCSTSEFSDIFNT